MTPAVLQALVALVELAAQVAPHIIAAVEAHGELTDEQKSDLIARVNATRAAVAAYEPHVPDPKPTAPG